MAKIKQINYFNREKGSGVESHLEYRPAERRGYSTRDPLFFIRIPDGYTELAETEEAKPFSIQIWQNRGRTYIAATGKDEEKAEENYRGYMDLYFASRTKTEKVLLFRHRANKPEKGFYGDREVSLKFAYKVCNKKTIGTASKYYEIWQKREEEVRSNRYDGDWHEIPYTEESEEFLKSIQKGMLDLIDKFDAFIGGPKKILETISKNQKLLA